MVDVTALLIARVQFAFTIGVHIVFPALSIGLAAYLAALEGLWLITKRSTYLDLYHYWLKIFSVGFGMGVVSGVVMSYEFGTNWANFSQKAGAITGPLLGYEVLTAFFLEAGFLGIMLFGMGRVSKGIHFFSTCMVSLGTLISMTWILASNSWMQTPQGYMIEPGTGRFLPENWLHIIFNPSFPYRLVHMALACFLCVALTVSAVAAFHILAHKKQNKPLPQTVKTMFAMATGLIVIAGPLQLLAGDAHGLNTLHYQPAKLAAIEGHWETSKRAGLILFGLPDMEAEQTKYAIELPLAGSLILTHSLDGTVPGLKDFPKQDRAPVPVVFFAFRLMVGLGILMALFGLYALWCRIKGNLFDSPLLVRWALLMGPAGFLALLCGWVTTEVGRQPYTIYGLLRTEHSASNISLAMVSTSMTAFAIVYFIVFGSGIFILMRMMGKLPAPYEGPGSTTYGKDHSLFQAQANTATQALTNTTVKRGIES
ncbi:cytochrome ubiquinol oxidase subunit I [Entomobacter blattae]|uniref:Cytochrome bd-II ubiquinol oxidase subunit 1 n=1 Tax=Entomobacter blattae TaxID=2762277 RepID=A0A7H1NQB6_9PROT|nr:cytochrome ubiquinol oxidase subunit I [Entomobacter blattae]QNT77976.1 Cytochrome bd-II ubiquinol oxidase subunit 1 [Entomobacter blattae]